MEQEHITVNNVKNVLIFKRMIFQNVNVVKYLDQISDEEILKLNIPTGAPMVYELNQDLHPINHYYLGDQDEVSKKTAAVADQGKNKAT